MTNLIVLGLSQVALAIGIAGIVMAVGERRRRKRMMDAFERLLDNASASEAERLHVLNERVAARYGLTGDQAESIAATLLGAERGFMGSLVKALLTGDPAGLTALHSDLMQCQDRQWEVLAELGAAGVAPEPVAIEPENEAEAEVSAAVTESELPGETEIAEAPETEEAAGEDSAPEGEAPAEDVQEPAIEAETEQAEPETAAEHPEPEEAEVTVDPPAETPSDAGIAPEPETPTEIPVEPDDHGEVAVATDGDAPDDLPPETNETATEGSEPAPEPVFDSPAEMAEEPAAEEQEDELVFVDEEEKPKS